MKTINNYIVERIRIDNIKHIKQDTNLVDLDLDTVYEIPGETWWHWEYDEGIIEGEGSTWKCEVFEYAHNKYIIYLWSEDCNYIPYMTSDDPNFIYIFEIGYRRIKHPNFTNEFRKNWGKLSGFLPYDIDFSDNISDIFRKFNKKYCK